MKKKHTNREKAQHTQLGRTMNESKKPYHTVQAEPTIANNNSLTGNGYGDVFIALFIYTVVISMVLKFKRLA